MSKYLTVIFKVLVGAASVVVLLVSGVFAYAKIQELMLVRDDDPEIELRSVKHWISGNKLIFSAIAENESEIEWLNASVNFIVKDQDGEFIRRCSTILLNEPFSAGPIDIEAVCPDMPSGFSNYTYSVKIIGEY